LGNDGGTDGVHTQSLGVYHSGYTTHIGDPVIGLILSIMLRPSSVVMCGITQRRPNGSLPS
jgi:hypothetical protein